MTSNFRKNLIIKVICLVILALLAGKLLYDLFYNITHWTCSRFIVQYNYVPAIRTNVHLFRINVHFRGYDVGDVTDIKLSKDQKHIEFYVNIHYKDLKIPTNSSIIFKNENIYGARYLDIKYPQKPSDKFIQCDEIIQGTDVHERIDEYVIEELSYGRAGKLIENLYLITNILVNSLKDKDNAKLLSQSSGDVAVILENLKDITEDPSFKKDIKSTIKHSANSLKSVDEILSDKEMRRTIKQAPETINKTMEDIGSITESTAKVSQTLPHVDKNLDCVNVLLTDTNCNLCNINTKIPEIPQSLVDNAEELVVKTSCFERELSRMLSKRFLILRLVFGNPGKCFKTCAKNRCIPPRGTAKK